MFGDGIYIKGSSFLAAWKGERWQPDTDWNQLMMVVEKIEKNTSYPNSFNLSVWQFALGDEYRACVISGLVSNGDTKIEAVYNACVEYIKTKKQ